MNRLICRVVLVALCCTGSAIAARDKPAERDKHAQPASETFDTARMVKVLADPALRAQAIKAGEKAAFFCENCHSEDGIGDMDYIPNLAQQNPVYMLVQLQKYADGRRIDEFKTKLTKKVKPEDMFNIVIFYSTLPLPPTPVRDIRQAQAGQRNFLRECTRCHGAQARGTNDVPRLAGQHSTYLSRIMSKYYGAQATRSDARMNKLSRPLTDPEIADLAAYLPSLP